MGVKQSKSYPDRVKLHNNVRSVQVKAPDTHIDDMPIDDGQIRPLKLLSSLHRRGSGVVCKPILPKRIILVRHGESLGNTNEAAYSTIPDSKIPLTTRGRQQAVEVGKRITELIGSDEAITIYTSPYLRTKQTLAAMLTELQTNPILAIREEPRLTEQQFGNFQRTEDMRRYKDARSKFGRFYYRFPDGESGLDVFGRVSSFIGTLHREWAKDRGESVQREYTVIIVTHGLTLRLFLMRWFRFSVAEFENSHNPMNGAIVVMQRREDSSRDSCTAEKMLHADNVDISDFDEDRGYIGRYQLDGETCQVLNLSKTICDHTAFYCVNDDLKRIISEAEDGYKIHYLP